MPSRSATAAGPPLSAEARSLTDIASRFERRRGEPASRREALAAVVKKPKATVVITHHNYSDHVAGAIDSVLNQSYANVDCIVVDDASDPEHRRDLRAIFESRRCDRLRLFGNETNVGQIPAFYVGVDNTDADFVCLLDPDDRYFPTFISETIEAHLNPYVVVPIVCCEQVYSSRGRQLTGVFLGNGHNDRLYQGVELEQRKRYTLRLYEWESRGWAWTSTSSMMFRRPALELMRPTRALGYKGSADAYLGRGAQFLGGTLFFDKPLVVREVHERNTWLNFTVLSGCQTKHNSTTAPHNEAICRADALISIVENDGADLFPDDHFVRVLANCFHADERLEVLERSPRVAQLWSSRGSHEARLAYTQHATNSRTCRRDRGWLAAFGKVLSLVLAKVPATVLKLALARLARPFGESRYMRRRIRYHRRLMGVAGAVSGLFGSSVRP